MDINYYPLGNEELRQSTFKVQRPTFLQSLRERAHHFSITRGGRGVGWGITLHRTISFL